MLRRLLIGVGKFKQRSLIKTVAEECQPGRQFAVRVAHGHGDRGKARLRREHLAVVAGGTLVVADFAGRVAPGGINNCLDLVAGHCFTDRRSKRIFLVVVIDVGTNRSIRLIRRLGSGGSLQPPLDIG